MKKLLFTLLTTTLLLTSCQDQTIIATVSGYTYSYITSEVQDYTHDCYLAIVPDLDSYIEVPNDCLTRHISIKQTNKIIYYYIYEVEHKVSNHGWEYVSDAK